MGSWEVKNGKLGKLQQVLEHAFYNTEIIELETMEDEAISNTAKRNRGFSPMFQSIWQEKRSSKVTIDNIHRILNSFLAWLKDENLEIMQIIAVNLELWY
ncbi:hypothetical protein [Eubacterium barkeri]|nr:hypothetical protein [Eubacterium barkeri]